MSTPLDKSFDWCQRLARRTAGNFYFSFLTLPLPLRRDMCALYAFMRMADDIGDEETIPLEQRRANLEQFRVDLRSALDDDPPEHPLYPALVDIIRRHHIPPEYLVAVIDGVACDFEPTHIQTFGELETYCYHVAGAVGLCCIHVWGFDGEEAIGHAIACGTAFQLTNILRDLAEDAEMSRLYLPQEDLDRFDYSYDDLRQHHINHQFLELMRFEVDRARGYYTRAEQLFPCLHPEGRPIFGAMLRIYGGLLAKIERQEFDVFTQRIRLSKPKKLWIACDSAFRYRWLGHTPKSPAG